MYKIQVPATSANLGPGFDSLGIALDLYNTFYFRKISQGIKIYIEDMTGENIDLSLEDNLVYQALKNLYQKLDQPVDGIEIIEEVAIPFSAGLGSSAAAIVAGLVGANRLLDNPLSEEEILKMATDMEGHPDNIVPSYTGGFTVNVYNKDKLVYKKLDFDENIKIVLTIPQYQLSTKKLRQVLPKKICYQDAIFNHSRTALLTASIYEHDWNLFKTAMEDKLHQDYRASLIPGFYHVLSSAYQAGALGVALSGAGPTIIAFCKENAAEIGQVMVDCFKGYNINSKFLITSPNNKGISIFAEQYEE